MDERKNIGIVETILFVSGDPVSVEELGQLLNMDVRNVKKLMIRMTDCYNFERRGLQIITVNDTYQLATRPEYNTYIERFIGKEHIQGISQAALETLAIVAYKQPITKADIESIRGVKSDHTIKILINMGYIKEVDRMDTPGRPILYGTTDVFLRNFGFTCIDDLPPLDENES